MLVALLAIAVGGTILSGLVTIYYDVPRQMGNEFRNYGANMIFLASSNDDQLTDQNVEEAVGQIRTDQLVGVAPFRYEMVQIHEQPIGVAGTDMEGAKATSPYWLVDGEWPAAPGAACGIPDVKILLVGQEEAQYLNLKVGDTFEMVYSTENDEVLENGVKVAPTANMTVTGILETGGSEEKYVYISMEDLEELTGEAGTMDVVELSVSAERDALDAYTRTIHETVPSITPRLVKRVTESESQVLTKLQALVLLVTSVVLVLTMICVATTMTAVVTERRKEIGLRKALGATDQEIIGEFMGEGLLLGGLGGLIGVFLGFAFAQYVSRNVFSNSITFQIWLLPVTILASILVTGLACLFPVRSATDVDPALVLKGE